MSYKVSDTARKLVALLDNAEKISVKHSNRSLALDTIASCRILCQSRRFNIKDSVWEDLSYAINNYQPARLLYVFQESEEQVLIYDRDTQLKSRPKS